MPVAEVGPLVQFRERSAIPTTDFRKTCRSFFLMATVEETTPLSTYLQTFSALFVRLQTRSERGAALLEYALLVSLIAVVCIASVSYFGQSISYQASEIGSAINN